MPDLDSAPEMQSIPDLVSADPAKRGIGSRILLSVGGVLLIVLGVIGWILPLVPGVPFLVLGFALLGMCSQRLAVRINRAEARLPIKWRLWLRPGPKPRVKPKLSELQELSNEELMGLLLGPQPKKGERREYTDPRL